MWILLGRKKRKLFIWTVLLSFLATSKRYMMQGYGKFRQINLNWRKYFKVVTRSITIWISRKAKHFWRSPVSNSLFFNCTSKFRSSIEANMVYLLATKFILHHLRPKKFMDFQKFYWKNGQLLSKYNNSRKTRENLLEPLFCFGSCN